MLSVTSCALFLRGPREVPLRDGAGEDGLRPAERLARL